MATYGMRIWGENGALQLDENSFTIRLVLSVLVTFGPTKSIQDFAVPGCNSSNSTAFVLPNSAVTDRQRQFETEMLDGVARVYNYTRTFEASSVAAGTMRLIVVRFK